MHDLRRALLSSLTPLALTHTFADQGANAGPTERVKFNLPSDEFPATPDQFRPRTSLAVILLSITYVHPLRASASLKARRSPPNGRSD